MNEDQPGVDGNEPVAEYPEFLPMTYVEIKPWYTSRTIAIALATALLAGLNVLTDTVKDPQVLSLLVALVAGISIWLRLVTGQPVSVKQRRRRSKGSQVGAV